MLVPEFELSYISISIIILNHGLSQMRDDLVSVIYKRRLFLGTVMMSGLIASIATVGIVKHLYHLSTRYITTPRKSVPVTLARLPLELQIQILSHLQWDEVLRARQTCRRLRDASLARPVWLALVKWYSCTVYPRPFCLEKPLEMHIDRELERLVLRWQKARRCWALRQCNSIPVQRRFLSPEKARNCVHLVEGGRWLLVGTNSGSILYYDLDATAIEPSILIPTPFDEDTEFDKVEDTEILLSVEMDLDAEYLKFNLGIMARRMPVTDPDSSLSPRYFRWIQVWQVNSDVDKHGEVKGLRAERLACFPEEYRNRCDSFRLHDQRVAYSLHTKYEFSDMRDGPCIIIVDWTSAKSASLVYPRKVVWRMIAEWLALLPENKILCHFLQKFFLFDLDHASLTTLDPSQYHRHLTEFDPVAELSLFADAISQPYFLNQCTRISILTTHGVRGVVVPHTKGISPSTIEGIKLLSMPFLDTQYACTGYDRAVICSWPELTTLQYAWPEDHPTSSDLVTQIPVDQAICEHPGEGRRPNVLFDELSGRIVLSVYETKKVLLLNVGIP